MIEPEHLDILLLEDEPADVRLIERTLREVQGFSTDLVVADTVETALQHLRDRHFDVALVDFFVDSDCGPEIVPELIAQNPMCAPILLTGHLTPETHHHAILNGAIASLSKMKLDPWQLEVTMRHAIIQRYRMCKGLNGESQEQANPNLQPTIYRHIQTALGDLMSAAEAFEQGLASGSDAVAVRSARDIRFIADDLKSFFADSLALSGADATADDPPFDDAGCDLQSVLLDVSKFLAPSCREFKQSLEIELAESPLMVDIPACVLRRALTDFVVGCMSISGDRGRTSVSAESVNDLVVVSIRSQISPGVATDGSAVVEFNRLTASALALLDPFGVELSEASDIGDDASGSAFQLRFAARDDGRHASDGGVASVACGCSSAVGKQPHRDTEPAI